MKTYREGFAPNSRAAGLQFSAGPILFIFNRATH